MQKALKLSGNFFYMLHLRRPALVSKRELTMASRVLLEKTGPWPHYWLCLLI